MRNCSVSGWMSFSYSRDSLIRNESFFFCLRRSRFLFRSRLFSSGTELLWCGQKSAARTYPPASNIHKLFMHLALLIDVLFFICFVCVLLSNCFFFLLLLSLSLFVFFFNFVHFLFVPLYLYVILPIYNMLPAGCQFEIGKLFKYWLHFVHFSLFPFIFISLANHQSINSNYINDWFVYIANEFGWLVWSVSQNGRHNKQQLLCMLLLSLSSEIAYSQNYAHVY